MEAAIKRYQEHTLQSHIDPASRVFFATQGDVFRVDRLAPELCFGSNSSHPAVDGLIFLALVVRS